MPEPYALPSSPILLGQYRPPFRLSLVPMRHPSMFSAPHPCSHTHCATLPVNGLRATSTSPHEAEEGRFNRSQLLEQMLNLHVIAAYMAGSMYGSFAGLVNHQSVRS